MMRLTPRSINLVVLLALAGAGLALGVLPGRAADAAGFGPTETQGLPTAVSPGSAEGSAIGDSCPTFSWGAVAGADNYEVIVYLIGEDDRKTEAVLKKAVPGSASSWTPSLDRCLEPGGRYAWSVRALSSENISEWSPPRLFQVTVGPTETDFERALAIVRQYVEDSGQAEVAEAEEVGTYVVSPALADSAEATAVATLPPPQPLAPAATVLSVDGNVDAVSFSGNGNPLTGLNPVASCFSATERFVDCGNGTVTDGVTGLIWMKNANCYGLMNWSDSNTIATTFNLAVCGVTDGSRPGDWRLPTKEEWEAIIDSSCPAPKIKGNSGCHLADPWASNVLSQFYWSSSTVAGITDKAHDVNLMTGAVPATGRFKNNSVYFWPVRTGQ